MAGAKEIGAMKGLRPDRNPLPPDGPDLSPDGTQATDTGGGETVHGTRIEQGNDTMGTGEHEMIEECPIWGREEVSSARHGVHGQPCAIYSVMAFDGANSGKQDTAMIDDILNEQREG